MNFRSLAVVCLFVFAMPLEAEETLLPRWELGVALGGQALPDYRGSREQQVQAYPIPILVYRGRFLKADRNGVRGEFLANNRFEINLSGETALNGGSSENSLRDGMPELESAFELGPSLNVNLSGVDFSSGWQLRLPLRGVITAGESGVHDRGFTFNPRLTYVKPDVFWGWRGKLNAGLLYGTDRYHDYYYSVQQPYVTDARGFYDADAGFSGYYFKTSLSRRQGDFWWGLSLRYDNLSDTKFEASPLVETTDYFAFSFVAAWLGWHSNE